MAVLEIKKYPDPILKRKAGKVEEITPELRKLAEDMIQTMLKSEPEGIGLAAPQIGVSKRIFIARTEQNPVVFINPKVIERGGQKSAEEEGCLSLPDVWLKIRRTKEIEVEAIDINGKKIKIKADGLMARVLQHEIDHLNGVLIIDKIGFIQKFKIKRTLKRR